MLRSAALALLLAVLALSGTGCGGTGDSRSAVNPTAESLPDGEARGARVIRGTGCLACHRLGEEGADGPGPDLGDVGARLAPDEIRETLLAGRAPMPSYAGLPAADLDALVTYLSARR